MTNLITLRSVEEFYGGYTPGYVPVMPTFLNGKNQKYNVEVGSLSFKSLKAMGDIRSRMITPKDTEIHQINATSGSKDFKKYLFASQYVQSDLQNTQGYEDVVAQVLDEHNKQNDELFLTGEGTSMGNVVNNGLFYSGDPNYDLNGSYAVQLNNGSHLADMYAKLVSVVQDVQETSGKILVLTYGAAAIGKYNGLFPNNNTSFSATVQQALADVSFAKLPTAVTPAGDGFIVVNLDQVKTHYMMLPAVFSQGTNPEKMYAWTNFLMGSSMLEVLAYGAVTRQPLTFA